MSETVPPTNTDTANVDCEQGGEQVMGTLVTSDERTLYFLEDDDEDKEEWDIPSF